MITNLREHHAGVFDACKECATDTNVGSPDALDERSCSGSCSMIRSSAVQSFAEKAQKTETPGLYGVFSETDFECEILWRYLGDYAETCDDVSINTAQQELTFTNGARVRVFCSAWRTYYGMRFHDVLIADKSIRLHVYSLIIRGAGKVAAPEETPKPVFGL